MIYFEDPALTLPRRGFNEEKSYAVTEDVCNLK